MTVELINTGSELLLGRVLNLHQQWLGCRLHELGYPVVRQVTVGDAPQDIEQSVRDALSRVDLVLTTGGLGPTSDDTTRESVARLLGRPLREDASILALIEQFFAARNRPMPECNRVQALVPEGATVLDNPHGTAPGLAIEVRPNPFRADGRTSWLVMLPGPPRELRPMFEGVVLPYLRQSLPVESAPVYRTLRTTGIGESRVQDMIGARLRALVDRGLNVGYCARVGQVDVRLGGSGADAATVVREAEAIVRRLLGQQIFGVENEDLETVVVRKLAARKQTLVLAESCTGGCIAHRVTNVPGASEVLLAGLVTYSNESKLRMLGVRADTLAHHGAVSEAVAREMAVGARQQNSADYAISVTGIAGPAGGTSAKPVGTVFIGLASPDDLAVERYFNPYDRETFKEATAQQALQLLLTRLTGR